VGVGVKVAVGAGVSVAVGVAGSGVSVGGGKVGAGSNALEVNVAATMVPSGSSVASETGGVALSQAVRLKMSWARRKRARKRDLLSMQVS
jgi:hypothetical protein